MQKFSRLREFGTVGSSHLLLQGSWRKNNPKTCSVCSPSLLSPVMGAILRDKPLCSGLTLRGYCHCEVGAGEIPEERVGREGDRQRQKKKDGERKIRDKQTEKKNNKAKTESNLGVSQNKGDSVGRSEVVSEMEEGARSWILKQHCFQTWYWIYFA